jgi:tetratricopeptide (TPR) repeat protein
MVKVSHVAVLVLAALLYASLLQWDEVVAQDVPSIVALHPEVAELLESVAQLRSNGELEGLLELLSEAEGINPNHPAVAKEFALTYEQLGQPDEAQKHWKRIMAGGEAAGGTFYEMAKQRLPIGGAAGEVNRITTAEPAELMSSVICTAVCEL